MTDTSTPRDSASRISVGARLAVAGLLIVVMLAGILILGRLASSDVMAMALTTVFFLVLGAGLLLLARRRRELLLPLGGVYVLVAGGAGVLLGLPLVTDDVVDEEVVVVDAPAPTQGSEDGQPEPAAPQLLASGEFEARDHPGMGTATLVDTGDGAVVTLTDFATDNGPDLFVYLVPAQAPAGSVEGFVDLGTLKGNVGDQQYVVPDDVDPGPGWRVVVWCRAFAVTFTEAVLS